MVCVACVPCVVLSCRLFSILFFFFFFFFFFFLLLIYFVLLTLSIFIHFHSFCCHSCSDKLAEDEGRRRRWETDPEREREREGRRTSREEREMRKSVCEKYALKRERNVH